MDLFAEEIARPEQDEQLFRARLPARLAQSLKSRTATIIPGVAGTGKTAVAPELIRRGKLSGI
ncbi:MAG: hypothetical protein ABR568_02870 [Pyrinomonadaceae bacterium]